MFRISISILLSCIVFSLSNMAIADYYKVSNSGKVLPASATLGTGSNDWGCTWDSRAGLLWEIKTTSGTRSQDTSYKWSESSGFVSTVNRSNLCGNSSWRMPTKTELESLIYCPAGKSTNWVENFRCISYQNDGVDPQISPNAFPNTAKSSSYWTSDNYPNIANTAYFVNFYTGDSDFTTQFDLNKIRLVLPVSGLDTSTGSAIGTSNSTTPTTSNGATTTTPTTVDPSACFSFIPGGPCVNLGSTSITTPTNKPPVAAFIATANGLSIDLDGSTSTDSDGSINSYEWTIALTGQTTLTATGIKPASIKVAKAGTYTVTLKVTDNSGKTNNTNSKSQSVVVSDSVIANAKPVANITYKLSPQDGILSATGSVIVSLDATGSSDSDGQIKSYSWSDNINQSSGESKATFTYKDAATYRVTLTVTDDKGATNSTVQSITIGPKIVPVVEKASTKDFFKISMTGDVLPDSATIADKNFTANDWVCTYDSRTNLIWQVVTIEQTLNTTVDGLTQSFNAQNACGVTDWHAPGSDELRSLIMCSSGLPQLWNKVATGCEGTYTSPTVDVSFFPNTTSGPYSSTTFYSKKLEKGRSDNVWFVDFSDGSSGFVSKTKANTIRLVSGAQVFDYLNNPTANYDDSTRLLVIDSILSTDGKLYHFELERNDYWQFTVKSRYVITGGQANIAKFVGANIEIERVYAMDRVFKNVIMVYDPVNFTYSLKGGS